MQKNPLSVWLIIAGLAVVVGVGYVALGQSGVVNKKWEFELEEFADVEKSILVKSGDTIVFRGENEAGVGYVWHQAGEVPAFLELEEIEREPVPGTVYPPDYIYHVAGAGEGTLILERTKPKMRGELTNKGGSFTLNIEAR